MNELNQDSAPKKLCENFRWNRSKGLFTTAVTYSLLLKRTFSFSEKEDIARSSNKENFKIVGTKILSNEFSVWMNYCNILKPPPLTIHYNLLQYLRKYRYQLSAQFDQVWLKIGKSTIVENSCHIIQLILLFTSIKQVAHSLFRQCNRLWLPINGRY